MSVELWNMAGVQIRLVLKNVRPRRRVPSRGVIWGGGARATVAPKEKEKKKEKRKKKEGNYMNSLIQITTYKVLFFPIFQ